MRWTKRKSKSTNVQLRFSFPQLGLCSKKRNVLQRRLPLYYRRMKAQVPKKNTCRSQIRKMFRHGNFWSAMLTFLIPEKLRSFIHLYIQSYRRNHWSTTSTIQKMSCRHRRTRMSNEPLLSYHHIRDTFPFENILNLLSHKFISNKLLHCYLQGHNLQLLGIGRRFVQVIF